MSEFHDAIDSIAAILAEDSNNIEAIEGILVSIIPDGENINSVNEMGLPPIHYAASKNELEVLFKLIERGAQFDKLDAAEKIFIDYIQDADKKKEIISRLRTLVGIDKERLGTFLKASGSAETDEGDDVQLDHWLKKYGFKNRDAVADSGNAIGYAPMRWAFKLSAYQIIILLLEKEASLVDENNRVFYESDEPLGENKLERLKYFYKEIENCEGADEIKQLVFVDAIKRGYSQLVEFHLKLASVNKEELYSLLACHDNDKRNPVHHTIIYRVKSGNVEIYDLVYDALKNVSEEKRKNILATKDAFGMHPYEYSYEYEENKSNGMQDVESEVELVDWLEQYGFNDVNAVNSMRFSPMGWAFSRAEYEIMRVLLVNGAAVIDDNKKMFCEINFPDALSMLNDFYDQLSDYAGIEEIKKIILTEAVKREKVGLVTFHLGLVSTEEQLQNLLTYKDNDGITLFDNAIKSTNLEIKQLVVASAQSMSHQRSVKRKFEMSHSIESLDYYHGNLWHDEAENLLENQPEGTGLLIKSKHDGHYRLIVKDKEKECEIYHILLPDLSSEKKSRLMNTTSSSREIYLTSMDEDEVHNILNQNVTNFLKVTRPIEGGLRGTFKEMKLRDDQKKVNKSMVAPVFFYTKTIKKSTPGDQQENLPKSENDSNVAPSLPQPGKK
ncbi:MAG: SH2 domain-containing protein [Gammaproteobacteria bacterium]